jgi:hypothetical protein
MWSNYKSRKEASPDDMPPIDVFFTTEVENHVRQLDPVLPNCENAEIKIA